ncbi:hypothetical protein CGW93_03250 [candidate division bacterium WOR-3 4484_18]|uniref:tetrahydrofolate synthase n=1 Tax=candidate division WOR-3 bacterium 4484_18 TaxID=2020626 RepID=A0A257LVZ3_UNCW3|nr:MAG: hypothetical protein CGW93_03250 [candidate division bacterium WOR-3 4484_18]
MKFEEALDFLYGFKDFEKEVRPYRQSLFSFRNFLKYLGNPHEKIGTPIVVAGTKGKGSVATMLSYIIRESVGLYMSPHIMDVRERIQFENRHISGEDFAHLMDTIKPIVTNRRTVFELLTTMAFMYFANKSTKYSVLEVGLGGRLDATNVVDAKIAVITNIDYDHTHILGRSLFQIAREKAGIIKQGAYVIYGAQKPEVREVIEHVAKLKGANPIELSTAGIKKVELTLQGTYFQLDGEDYFVPLLGGHQVLNAMLAIKAAQMLGIPKEQIKAGIECVKLRGRVEILQHAPWYIVDGAHNTCSIKALMDTINRIIPYKRLFLIFSVMRDKDVDGIAAILAPHVYYAYWVPIDHPRAMSPAKVAKIFTARGVTGEQTELVTAIGKLNRLVDATDLVLVTGSFYLVGEFLKLYEHRG